MNNRTLYQPVDLENPVNCYSSNAVLGTAKEKRLLVDQNPKSKFTHLNDWYTHLIYQRITLMQGRNKRVELTWYWHSSMALTAPNLTESIKPGLRLQNFTWKKYIIHKYIIIHISYIHRMTHIYSTESINPGLRLQNFTWNKQLEGQETKTKELGNHKHKLRL